MSRPDPRTPPQTPVATQHALALEEPGSEIDDRDEATLLLRLAGASTLAILALAVASLVIV